MVGGIACMADRRDRGRTRVRRVGGRGVVLEGLVMRNVVRFRSLGDRRGGAALAAGGAVRIGDREVEAALEQSPGDARGVEQVADILAAEADRLTRRGGADVAERIGIADQR